MWFSKVHWYMFSMLYISGRPTETRSSIHRSVRPIELWEQALLQPYLQTLVQTDLGQRYHGNIMLFFNIASTWLSVLNAVISIQSVVLKGNKDSEQSKELNQVFLKIRTCILEIWGAETWCDMLCLNWGWKQVVS